MKVNQMQVTDLTQLPGLQPDGWGDIRTSFQFYLRHPFCHPFCAWNENEIVGVGSCIIHGTTAWLCHIIVHPDARGRGIGKHITDHLIEVTQKLPSVKTVMLLATSLGAPVYQKSGFEAESEYIFYKGETITVEETDIVPCNDNLFDQVLALDQKISGETRTLLLQLYRRDCFVKVVDGRVQGCYFPSLGDGLIIAEPSSVGVDLMRLRAQRENRFVIPEQNEVAADFLSQHGYQPVLTGTRMRLGKRLPWKPQCLYNRIGGNLG